MYVCSILLGPTRKYLKDLNLCTVNRVRVHFFYTEYALLVRSSKPHLALLLHSTCFYSSQNPDRAIKLNRPEIKTFPRT